MTIESYILWIFRAGFLAGAGLTIVLVRIRDFIAAACHLLQRLRKRFRAQ